MNKNLDYLEQLGLSKIEAKLYLSLLQSGPMTVKEVAGLAKINRTASYTHITSLLEKGVIAEVTKGSRKHLVACEPERLRYLIVRKLDSLRSIEAKFPHILSTIQASLTRETNEQPVETKYYKGINGLIAISDEAMQAKELRCYANLNELPNVFLDDKNRFEKALMKNKTLKIFEIIADIPNSVKNFNLESTSQTGRYYYKFMPTNIGLTSSTLIYDNKVAVINAKKDISGVVLCNADYYNNSKKLFDFIWNTLPQSSNVTI